MVDRYVNIIVNSKKAEKDVDKFDKQLTKTGNTANKVSGRMKALSAAIIGALVGGAMGKAIGSLVKAQREFDKLNAALVTATGSAEGAKVAFQGIENLAATTPYSVNEVTQAFVKLRNLGLDPSERAIKSYGNTAAAMGTDIMQFIEAVADASTREFERLKEFGIIAKNQGDTVAFTFQGMTKTIKNSAEEIEGYLMALGENEFASAQANRMATLDGALSNLGDAWDRTVKGINQSGFASAVESAVRLAISALDEFNAALDSGQLGAYFNAMKMNFRGFADDFARTGNMVLGLFGTFSSETKRNFENAGEWISAAFTNAIPNIRSFIQVMTVELAARIHHAIADVKYFYTVMTTFSFEEARKQYVQDWNIMDQARKDSIASILTENAQIIEAKEKEIAKAKELRAEYEKVKESQKGDVLGQFGIEGDAPERVTETAEGSKMMQGMAAETSMMQAELDARHMLWQHYGQQLVSADKDNYNTRLMELDYYLAEQTMRENMAFENELARISQQAIALSENKKISEEERMMGMMELEQQELLAKEYHQQSLTEIEAEGVAARNALKEKEREFQINTAQGLFSTLMNLAQGQSKKSFEAAKKISMAIAIAKGWESATSAFAHGMASGGPVGAALFTAMSLATTGAQIKSLSSTNFSSNSMAGGGGGSAPSAPSPSIPTTATQVTEQTQQRRSIEVKIQPGLFSHEQVREILQVAQGDDETIAGWNQAQQDAQRRGVIASV